MGLNRSIDVSRPRCGSKVWKALDREVGETRKDRGQMVTHGNLQATTAFRVSQEPTGHHQKD